MARSKASTNEGRVFKFITTDTPGPTKDPVLRTIIRKQAMLDAGRARRLRGNHGRINLGNGPPVICDCLSERSQSAQRVQTIGSDRYSTSEDESAVTDAPSDNGREFNHIPDLETLAKTSGRLNLAYILSLNPRYDQARNKFGIELRNLSLLTNFNTMKSRAKRLSGDPQGLVLLMKHRHWSYLEFVPSFYDTNECVTAAADCLWAKVANILMPNTRDPEVEVRLYVRALRVLQKAIEDPAHQFDVEVLCAIQLVSMRDLMDYKRGDECDAWVSHILGCAKLVQRRGAMNFKSEFEKALFVAHVGPVLSEAFRNNRPCYLEQADWTKLYRSLAIETGRVGHRTPMSIHLRALMFPFPRLWRDVNRTMTGRDVFNTEVLRSLEDRCRKLHTEILPRVKECTDYLATLPPSKTPEYELAHRRALLVAAIDCLVLVKRLLVTLCDSMRAALEAEVQGLAQWVVEIVDIPAAKRCWIVSDHGAARAHAVIRSAMEYAEAITTEPWEKRRLQMRKCFLAWHRLLQAEFYDSKESACSGSDSNISVDKCPSDRSKPLSYILRCMPSYADTIFTWKSAASVGIHSSMTELHFILRRFSSSQNHYLDRWSLQGPNMASIEAGSEPMEKATAVTGTESLDDRSPSQCYLLDSPAELRNKIYKHALYRPEGVEVISRLVVSVGQISHLQSRTNNYNENVAHSTSV